MMPDPKVRIPAIDVFPISRIADCEFEPIHCKRPSFIQLLIEYINEDYC